MALIQVILLGNLGTPIFDTFDYPIVLQFGEKTTYDNAVWVVPSFPGRIPAGRLSEIRVQQGRLSILIDGPEGFRSGPHTADWVRGYYPRGKDCSFIQTDRETGKVVGVTLTTVEGSLFVDDLMLGGAPASLA